MIEHIDNHDDWIRARLNGIGASEAACLTGDNPYKTNVELWREKCGLVVPEDISDKPYVQFGKQAEKHIRGLFEIIHKDEYTVEYSEFDIHHNNKHPFIFATLDGILTDRDGRKGILEIKTTEIRRKSDWNKWADCIPQNYYIQLLHQLLVTGYDFVVICALIKYQNKTGGYEYKIITDRLDRKDVEHELEMLLEKEIRFWGYVTNRTEPPTVLPNI